MPTLSPTSTDPALETQLFLEKYRAQFLGVLAVLLLALIGVAVFRYTAANRAIAAAGLLSAAKSVPDYQQIIDRYPQTKAAADAYLLMAGRQRNEKKFAEANVSLHSFIDRFPKDEMVTTAWMGIAANLESLGKNDEARGLYRKLAAEYAQSFVAPLALLSQAHLLKEAGKTEEARRACETVMTQYRDSLLAGEASRQLRSMRKAGENPEKPAAKPSP
jgi:tetratricopeptide (TPR) repeat protein